MHFATYGRKSIYSDKSDSVANQERMCREYIEFRFSGKIDSFETYSDEGLTGANMNRPGLKQLLADVEDGRIDVLIVYQLDRLSRNVKDFVNIYATLEEHHVMFLSLKENIDTDTAIGKAMMFITATFAQMERETIAARVTDNMTGLAKKGFWTGGKPPKGYILDRIKVNGKEHATLSIDPEAAKYCEWIFDVFLENGTSLYKTQNIFRKQGIRTERDSFLSASQIYNILTSPYCVEAVPEIYDYFLKKGCQMDSDSPREKWDGTYGVVVYGRTNRNGKKTIHQSPDKWIVCIGHHKPFLCAKKWLAVQEQLHKNIIDKTMKYEVPLLKGVLRCHKCGWIMPVSRKKLKSNILSHYHCRKRNQQGIEACNMKAIKCTTLDNMVLDIFRKIEADPKSIMQYVETKPLQDNEKNYSNLVSQANRLQAKIEHLTEALSAAEGSTAFRYIIAQIEKEDLNLESIKREMEIAKANLRQEQNVIKTVEERAKQIAQLIRGLDGFTDIEKNEIVREVVQECSWDGKTLFLRL